MIRLPRDACIPAAIAIILTDGYHDDDANF